MPKKGALYEGGIRVPFVARWLGQIKKGTVSDHVSCFQDMLPTFAELAKGKVPEQIDGISMLATLTGKKHPKKNMTISIGNWAQNKQYAWAIGKQFARGKRRKIEKIELFNLADDVGEKQNIADQHAEIVKKMKIIFLEAHQPSKIFPNKLLDGLSTSDN